MRGISTWCHPKGREMEVRTRRLDQHYLVFESRSATLRIMGRTPGKDKQWLVSYEIRHGAVDKTTGLFVFSSGELRTAFGLSEESGYRGNFVQGKFTARNKGRIRYLNIPGPGTGKDGDSNISIHLDKKGRDAVQELLDW